MTHTRLIQIYTLILLVIRVGFLFQQKNTVIARDNSPQAPMQIEKQAEVLHGSADIATETGSLALGEREQIQQVLPLDYAERESNINLLQQLYAQSPSEDILAALIKVLLGQHRFDEAYSYVQEAVNAYPGALDPHTHIYATFHAPTITISQPASIRVVENLINEYRQKNLISSDDFVFYQAMIQFWHNDFAAAKLLLAQISSPKYQSITTSLLNTFDTLSRQKDMPGYYTDAIIALTLMKNGYYTIAKKIATSVVLQNKSYILPYQILAYSHFMTQNWDTAIEYLMTLRNLESKQAQRYIFLIGVAHYRRGDHTQAILYLNQVTSPGLVADAYRYMFLSYIAGGEYARAHATWQKLLGNIHIIKNDFYSYFYEIFYSPLRHETDAVMYQSNPGLAQMSIDQCFTVLNESQHDVCYYGKAGLAIHNSNMQQASDILERLLVSYDAPYLLHAMGDYYAMQGLDIQAEQYYTQAMQMSYDTTEQSVIQKKIVDLR